MLNPVNRLLLSNYSFAVFTTDWKEEKILPKAVLITSLQAFFPAATLFLVFYPQVRHSEDLAAFLFLLGLITLLFLGLFPVLVSHRFKKLSLRHPFRKPGFLQSGFAFSVVITLTGLLSFLFFSFQVMLGFLPF